MDEVAVVSLALTLAFQAAWQRNQRNASAELPSVTQHYSQQDAIILGHRFGKQFKGVKTAPDNSDSWLLNHVDSVAREIQRYESVKLRELALNVIPFTALNDRAARIEEDRHLEYQDALVQALVEWAKTDFLKWVDPVKCELCSGPTEGTSAGIPTEEEPKLGAGRVELYRCANNRLQCYGHVTRFPRYSDLEKLLQTRTGRCGEFAAVFMLLLRSLNVRARYIWNSEDHVWNEYYSDALRRWVHVDSCEGARDKNLLYDQGWGKKMKYCIAFGIDGARDVTRSYVSNWQETLARRDGTLETTLGNRLAQITDFQRKGRSVDELKILREEDESEERWLSDWKARADCARRKTMSGRSSGTMAWKLMRAEVGGNTGSRSAPAMIPARLIADVEGNISEVNLNGAARVKNNQIILTEDTPSQTGSAFLPLPIELQDVIVITTFTIKHEADDGADGMAIVFHSDTRGLKALGQGGCDMGYGGLLDCLAIELDTYRSVDRCDDPPTPHISIHTGRSREVSAHHKASLWCSKQGAIPNIDDGRQYRLRAELSQNRKELRIFLDDSADGHFVELTDQPVKLSSLPDTGYRFVGWTAATGGLHQSHIVSKFEIREGHSREDVP